MQSALNGVCAKHSVVFKKVWFLVPTKQPLFRIGFSIIVACLLGRSLWGVDLAEGEFAEFDKDGLQAQQAVHPPQDNLKNRVGAPVELIDHSAAEAIIKVVGMYMETATDCYGCIVSRDCEVPVQKQPDPEPVSIDFDSKANLGEVLRFIRLLGEPSVMKETRHKESFFLEFTCSSSEYQPVLIARDLPSNMEVHWDRKAYKEWELDGLDITAWFRQRGVRFRDADRRHALYHPDQNLVILSSSSPVEARLMEAVLILTERGFRVLPSDRSSPLFEDQ